MPARSDCIEILLVEDSECDIELTRQFFSTARIRNNLHVVTDGEAALDYLFRRGAFTNASRPDIVLLDHNLPNKGGDQIVEILRQHQETKHLPVLMLSGVDIRRTLLPHDGAHIDAYLTKPLSIPAFFSAILSLEELHLSLAKETDDESSPKAPPPFERIEKAS